jgi:ubiquinone/menaquinone biosynthesis C-methylase UbiE
LDILVEIFAYPILKINNPGNGFKIVAEDTKCKNCYLPSRKDITMSQVTKAIQDTKIQVESSYKAQIDTFGPFDYPLLTAIIAKYNVRRILDVGTGEGSFLIGLAKRTKDVTFDAVDLNKSLIEIGKLNNKRSGLNINFQHANFGENFSGRNYDLIMARFAVEHIREVDDIDSFILKTYQRLNPGGWVVIIEYYLHDLEIEDPVWKAFRKSELATYKKANAHPRISLRLPESLKKTNFKNIKSTFNHISPATIKADCFFNLILEYTKLYSQICPEYWPKELIDKIVKWCDKKQPKGDPVLFVSHTIGQKI